ncbi:DUF333 domain-containing protein [Klebsiella pneumoniae]|uniref:putative hemolysin n=2 Tax=Klebsiella pneumoniae TaxID=573 RepID=UPI002F2B66A0
MKKLLAILPLALAGCTQPQPTAPTKTIGMPNPAAVYCQQSGGTRVPVQTPQGVSTQCKLPSGELRSSAEGVNSLHHSSQASASFLIPRGQRRSTSTR